MRFVFALFALGLTVGETYARSFKEGFSLDGRTSTPIPGAGPDVAYLGLLLWEFKPPNGDGRCLVVHVYVGPAGEADAVREGDLILALNGVEVHSAAQFREQLEKVSPGSEVRLRVERADPRSFQITEIRDTALRLQELSGFSDTKGIGGGAAATVSIPAGSYREWAQPIDWIRPPSGRVAPDTLVKTESGPTTLERFLDPHLAKQKLKDPIDRLRRYLAEKVVEVYGANMLDRVAYGYYRPSRLPELQVSITQPLARIVDGKKDPWEITAPILAEAAKNLDVAWPPQGGGTIDLATPRQSLSDMAQRVSRAATHIENAFGELGAAQRAELQTSLPQLVELFGRATPSRALHERAITRARQASMSVDYAGLFTAAAAVAAWRPASEPPTEKSSQGSVPRELAGAVKGDVLAVDRIDGRWYVYGGSGRNEYDLSQVDVVIDAGGNDLYRYSTNQRPGVQLVLDWAGNDRYDAAQDVAGPASGMRGVSVLIDHAGNDYYEGRMLSCGFGAMGIGLIVDHGGTDRYVGKVWSLGAGYYGFGGIVDLGNGEDEYYAEQYGQGVGGPRGFGLILDEGGSDFYSTDQPPNNHRFFHFVQGAGVGNTWPIVGSHDTGGIGVLCDLGGNDRYEAGRFSQGHSYFYGLGILHDRAGNGFYRGNRWSQGSAVHGGVGILADDGGDDTYWAFSDQNQGGSSDFSLSLLIDRGGNDSYESRGGGTQGHSGGHGVGWLIDLEGQDRYIAPKPSPSVRTWTDVRTSQGESGTEVRHNPACRCFSWSLLLDAGGTSDYYSLSGRGDGIVKSTGTLDAREPERSGLHGLFIDTRKKIRLWP